MWDEGDRLCVGWRGQTVCGMEGADCVWDEGGRLCVGRRGQAVCRMNGQTVCGMKGAGCVLACNMFFVVE